MPYELGSIVRQRTVIHEGYRAHAAHQSMAIILADWEGAFARLGRQIDDLRDLHAERLRATKAGEWPPTMHSEPGTA